MNMLAFAINTAERVPPGDGLTLAGIADPVMRNR
ncbi:hypothetical protein J2X76_006017 [Neorhizobium sp. 2083]|nr:hypothetical protein [Neorhizobium sp. 2083]